MLEIPLFFVIVLMVSSDVTTQAITQQTYPVYQQNGYPNLQPNEYQPYHQEYSVQNQIPPRTNPKTSIKQILMNELLSSPSVQAILSSMNNNYNPNSIDLPYNQMPQPNNYYFTPTETVNSEITNAVQNSDTKQKTKSKKKKKRKRKTINRENNDETLKEQLNEMAQSYNRDIGNNSSKKSKKQSNIIPDVNNNTRNIQNRDENTIMKPKNRKNLEETNENNTTQNKKTKSRKKRKKQNRNETITDEVKQTNKAPNLPTEQININELNEGDINRENRFTRNLAPDANILKAWPNLHDDYNKNLFPTINNPFYNPVLDKFFENYYQTLLNNSNNVTKPIRRNKSKKRKRPKEVSKPIAKKPEPPKLVTKLIVIEDNLEPTEQLENTNVFKNQSEPIDTEPKHDVKHINPNDENRNESDKMEYNTTCNEIPTENSVKPNDFNTDYNYYGLIDDYYPTFNDNAAYNADHIEYFVKNNNNNDHNYLNDAYNNYNVNLKETVKQIPGFKTMSNYEQLRQIETENTFYVEEKPRTEEERLAQQIIKEIEKRKEMEKQEIERRKELEDKITFQSPPFLTSPNFITRQIDKNKIKYEYHPEIRYVGEKIDTTKTKQNTKEYSEKHKHDVETTFARSKVVKYGPSYSEEDSYSGVINNLWHDFDDGGTVYVMAKSLDSPDIIW